ncbi:hypothetical protein [Natronospora cellulosivora (SeqCode)]
MGLNLRDYYSLLAKFPENQQGLGREVVFKNSGLTEQAMTYALILSAEVLRYHYQANDESRRRIQKSISWLLENSDMNNDGFPGWGLPQAWDAFADGSVNPPHHPYTITTAFVIEGLIDALSINSFWKEKEYKNMLQLLKEVSLYWCHNVWSEYNEQEGYFWYSISSNDAYFSTNVSAMFLGCLSHLISEHSEIYNKTELKFLKALLNKAANGMVNNVLWEQNYPFWNSLIDPPVKFKNRANDLLHHLYILWGMEKYRIFGNETDISWSIEEAIRSLDYYWKDGLIYEFPLCTVGCGIARNKPARVWAIGIMLAFYAKYGREEKTHQCIDILKINYKFPDLSIYPANFSKDNTFYARYAAHVLFGLAYMCFYKSI